jgi:SHAQKYF class myb-like DNA-binding protein
MNDDTGIISHNKINQKNEDLTLDEANKQLQKELLIAESEKGTKEDTQINFLNKKTSRFKDSEKKVYNNSQSICSNIKKGKWSQEENNEFFVAINKYGIDWVKINSLIKTRTLVQIKSHAYEIFHKLKTFKDEQLGIDFTQESINNIKDMVYYVKSKKNNYNNKNIFEYLYNQSELKTKLKNTDINNKDINFKKDDNLSQILDINEHKNLINNNNTSFKNNINIFSKNNIIFNNNININLYNYFYNNQDELSLKLYIIIYRIINIINILNNDTFFKNSMSNLRIDLINFINSRIRTLVCLLNKINNNAYKINMNLNNININKDLSNNNGSNNVNLHFNNLNSGI